MVGATLELAHSQRENDDGQRQKMTELADVDDRIREKQVDDRGRREVLLEAISRSPRRARGDDPQHVEKQRDLHVVLQRHHELSPARLQERHVDEEHLPPRPFLKRRLIDPAKSHRRNRKGGHHQHQSPEWRTSSPDHQAHQDRDEQHRLFGPTADKSQHRGRGVVLDLQRVHGPKPRGHH